MADNVHRYGIMPFKTKSGNSNGPTGRIPMASAKQITVGGTTHPLKIGDPILRDSAGMADICLGLESAGSASTYCLGIVAGFEPLYNAATGKREPARVYPAAGITYGSILERQTTVLFYPAAEYQFTIDCDDAVTATTAAAYQAFVGENVQHVMSVVSLAELNPLADIAGHATTSAAFMWRIDEVRIFDPNNTDFTGNYVKLIVSANHAQEPWDTGTGV